ncbi:hypothetical protein [Chondromyces apiculatus]|uniref:adenosine deaminase n=1 Tax=Chondromyces apiculatus DSM 436 TaxID=1192034 RepID=A0A017TH70_9BACT|nr:hypothetical protein [Chondromyces apiculatus]EYF08277.1 Hypothetical protein CAP_6038 [Chondromyces apiculatus DSM 436]
MSSLLDRWELVEPLLFAHALRDPSAFQRGASKTSLYKDLTALRREHRFEDASIAQAFSLLGEDAPSASDDKEEALCNVIRDVATRWLVADGDHWALREEPDRPGHEIIRWRGVSMLVPPSILAAGALSRSGHAHPCSVRVLPESLAPRTPVGHLHVHLGLLLPFEALWVQLWQTFLQRGTLDSRNGDGFVSIKEVPKLALASGEGKPWRRWQWMMELAFAARVHLMQANALEWQKVAPMHGVLAEFSRGKVDVASRGRALVGLWTDAEWRKTARAEARRLANMRDAWHRRLPASPLIDTDSEVRFIAGALRGGSEHEGRARLLCQYLRVKVALYSSLVVDPWSSGLRHFLDVAKRDKPYCNVIDDDLTLEDARLVAAASESPLRIEALEIHVTPSKWRKLPRVATMRHSPRPAWVLSFVRARDPGPDDPEGARASAQWRRARAGAGAECRLLARYLAMRPSLLREARALSLMDWERNGPVWLFEAPFRRLIEASREIAAGHPRLNLRPLHTAFHLGEDFIHLLSGLREIYEPFAWRLSRGGDRIGHALALGVSPSAWSERNPWIRMRPWDRILDIGFVYWFFDKFGLRLDAGEVERMRLDARRVIENLFGTQEPDPLETARNIWCALPQARWEDAKNGSEHEARVNRARSFVARILDERAVGRRALSSSLSIQTKLELPMLEAVHDFVHDRIAKARVAIEVNPSSNLLVGGFRSIFEQPVFHTDKLPIILNADDPLTFGTTLADDYAYAWAGMVLGSGQSPDQATRRLEEAARCSLRYTFTSSLERRTLQAHGDLREDAATEAGAARRRGP